jgi:hypothetical protein
MLAWSGDDRFRLTVTTLDMNVVGAYQYTALETKIQVVDFPLSNDESGMYIINVEYVNAKRKEDILVIQGEEGKQSFEDRFSVSNEKLARATWTLFVYTNYNHLETLIDTGSGSMSDIKFNFQEPM